jgi:hypothetical protein
LSHAFASAFHRIANRGASARMQAHQPVEVAQQYSCADAAG